ncbi:recombinase family protein [Thauera sp. ZXT1-4]|uniref:recombinase family protein n=1 Tax=Thauera sp. ZXT1-4 TaxID=3460294 RepID=UPI0040408E55
MTQRCAIYVRYSDDHQRPTSIDDQTRRCKELALQNGFSLENMQIYSDAAINGKYESESKP